MTSKDKKIQAFNVNGIGLRSDGIFGLPFSAEESETVIVPVPWDVTVSYGAGTAQGPEAIRNASYQVDLFDSEVPDAWKKGIAMVDPPETDFSKVPELRANAEYIISALEGGMSTDAPALKSYYDPIAAACVHLNQSVQNTCNYWLNKGKRVVLLGGDHSTPLGYLQALAKRHATFGILQIDAHADLRKAYEGFTYSHASIMYNALQLPAVSHLVQVGIRDYCEEEAHRINESNGRIITFFDAAIKRKQFNGETWHRICEQIINALPPNVYISFDIDGLDPKLCPHTGTPVAGGFETAEVLYLIEMLAKSGKQVIGFDLNEVAPGPNNDWDANVAARVLYRMCNLLA